MMSEEEAPAPPEPRRVSRICGTCQHVRVCKAFAMAVSLNKGFSEQNDFVKMLENPELIAKGCTEYTSAIPESDFGV
jgi:hypothetical protein